MTDSTTILLVLIPALPLGASIVTALFGARLFKDRSHVPVVVHDQLIKLARDSGVSVSAVVRELVTRGVMPRPLP